MAENNYLVRWCLDKSVSVVSDTAIQSETKAVGETVTALYGKKAYEAEIIELGKCN